MNQKTMITLVAGLLLAVLPATDALAAWNVRDDAVKRVLENILRHMENNSQRGDPIYNSIAEAARTEAVVMQPVPDDFGLHSACGKDYQHNASAIRSFMRQGFASVGADAGRRALKTEQGKLCGVNQVLSNIRYNEAVELINVTLPAIEQRYQNLQREMARDGDRDFNASGRNQITMQAMQFEFDLAMTRYRERQVQYDHYQTMVQRYSDHLGKAMMRGSTGDLLDAAIGAGIMEVALKR